MGLWSGHNFTSCTSHLSKAWTHTAFSACSPSFHTESRSLILIVVPIPPRISIVDALLPVSGQVGIMTLIVTPITVAQVATIMNAFITFISFTLSLFLAVLLIKFLPNTTTAIAWSAISRTLHSSLWPAVLRTDSGSGQTEGVVVSILTRLGTMTALLVAIAGVILPLGLSEGPLVHGHFRLLEGTYVPDNSPLAFSTTPNHGSFVYGRQCGRFFQPPVTCPGNDDPNTTTIAPSIIEIFNSTHHGAFSMQFRRFFPGDEQTKISVGFKASAETFFLRNNLFFTDGLLIDMTTESPGIGLWNQTIPTETKIGGTWSQDILWIEPETECVNTNLTFDYFLMDGGPVLVEPEFNLTDHGGFYNLAPEPPSFGHDGQNIDLRQHAYTGAANSNSLAMGFLNTTRDGSFDGSKYPLSLNITPFIPFSLTKITVLPLSYLNVTTQLEADAEIICRGFGGLDMANITNVHVNCAMFLGPPLRTDGGDPQLLDPGSKWTQSIHACSSATRVSVQTVTFSWDRNAGIQSLQINREKGGLGVLWAMEKSNLTIGDIDPLWGRVNDRYQNDSSLWTTRSNRFYLPAGTSSVISGLVPGMPAAAHTDVWNSIYNVISAQQDYSGESDYAVRAKLLNLVESDPIHGNAHIRNLIFVDLMSNLIIGTNTNNTLLVAEHSRSISYDFKYAIPGFLLVAIWTPSFFLTMLFFLTRAVSFEHMKKVLNHTSIGRIVVGASALRIQRQGGSGAPSIPVLNHDYDDAHMGDTGTSQGVFGRHHDKSGWVDTAGKTTVTLDLNDKTPLSRPIIDENSKLMETRSSHI